MRIDRSAAVPVVVAVACCVWACNHTRTSTEVSTDGVSDPDASATADVLIRESSGDASLEGRPSPCECDMMNLYSQSGAIVQPPLLAAERPASGYIAGLGWRETPSPTCAEGLKCMRPIPLDEGQLARFWNRYRTVRSAHTLPGCTHDVRIVIDFTSNTGVDHWVAIGRGPAYETVPISGSGTAFMETEGHVCHPLDPLLFRQIVDLLHIRNDVVTDPEYRKYL